MEAATAAEVSPARTPQLGARALLRVASGSFALNVANTAAAVATTVVLARSMDLVGFGIFSWVVATVYLLTVPAILGLDRLLIRDVAVYMGHGDDARVRGIIRRAFQIALIASALIVAAVVALAQLGGVGGDAAVALSIGVLALPALAAAWIAQSALMGMHRVVVGQAAELLLRPVLLLALVVIAALAVGGTLSAPLAAALFTASALASALAALLALRHRLAASVTHTEPLFETRPWLGAALGLLLLSGAQFANSQVGTVLLGLLDQAESAGLYTVAQRGALLVAFPLLALNAGLAPTAARLWAQREVSQLQRLATLAARAALLVALPIALTFALAGGTLLELVFGSAFVAAAGALAILCAGQIVNAATGSVATLLMMSGQQARAGYGVAAGLALNVGIGLVLIPYLAEIGAALAAAAGLIVANVVHVVMARRALRIDATALGLPPRSRP